MRYFLAVVLLLAGASTPGHASILLDGWLFNIDGQIVSFTDPLGTATVTDMNKTLILAGGTATINANGFAAGEIDYNGGNYQLKTDGTGSGLGTITVAVNASGAHTVAVWLDHSLSDAFFWDSGAFVGTLPGSGVDWGLDDPSVLAPQVAGGGALGQAGASPSLSDASMALRITHTSATGFSLYTFTAADSLSPSAPDFYLRQDGHDSFGDPDGSTIYFSADVADVAAVPEPGTWVLFAAGLLVMFFAQRSRRSAQVQ
jgi:hypothetical protein